MANETTPQTSSTSSKPRSAGVQTALYKVGARQSKDMAMLTAVMLVGVLALMTFLLSVGLQHPKPHIDIFLYSAFGTLGLNLLLYTGCMVADTLYITAAAEYDQAVLDKVKDVAALEGRRASALTTLIWLWRIQQALFALSIIAVVGFAISASQLFFAAASGAATQQGGGA